MTPTLSSTTEVRWLVCQVDKGMFSDERAVTYPASGNILKSVFVPATEVHGTPGQQGRVRVRLFRRNNLVMAVLPSENQDIVTIRESDLANDSI
jgi:predicted Mrr-cat superfamily restriction endonuclease